MKHLVIYVHGKGGNAAEAAHYQPLFPEDTVIGMDYQSQTPWAAKEEFPPFFEKQRTGYDAVTLIANSIGAFYALHALSEAQVQRAYLISPVADMEKLIQSRMAWMQVDDQTLCARGVIPTQFGMDLSWEYLCYVREHPITWNIPTKILYGEGDALTSLASVADFAKQIGAQLTVMPGGEHWFHTEEQMRFLDDWIRAGFSNGDTEGRKTR